MMKRLTFGVTSSPFLATQTLRQVAEDFSEEFPKAAKIVREDFYVDDLLTGASTVAEAEGLRFRLNNLLSRGGSLLRKWRSNSTKLLASIPDDLNEKESIAEVQQPRDYLNMLGIHWDTDNDTLHISLPSFNLTES